MLLWIISQVFILVSHLPPSSAFPKIPNVRFFCVCIYAHLFCFAKKYTWAALSGAECLDSAQLTVRDSVCTRICVCVHSRILLPSVDFMPH